MSWSKNWPIWNVCRVMVFDRISSPLGAAWTSLLTVLGFGKSFPSTLFFLGLEIPSSKIEKNRNNYLLYEVEF